MHKAPGAFGAHMDCIDHRHIANSINSFEQKNSNHKTIVFFFFSHFRMSAHTKIRGRLSSIGDSAPPSDSSEGSASESFEHGIDWTQQTKTQMHTNDSLFLSGSDSELHSLSPDNSGILSDTERAQVESFFSGLGTEVRVSERKLDESTQVCLDEWCERNFSEQKKNNINTNRMNIFCSMCHSLGNRH